MTKKPFIFVYVYKHVCIYISKYHHYIYSQMYLSSLYIQSDIFLDKTDVE
jgi:hypothetical protein